MKKGRHRRFEEARKLKQSGPGAFDLGFGDNGVHQSSTENDEYAAIAERYGVSFDEDDDAEEDEEEDEAPTPLTVMTGSYTNRLMPPDEAVPR